MSYNPQNPNGAAASTSSAPVTLATDQFSSTTSGNLTKALPIGGKAITAEQAAITAGYNTIPVVDKVGKLITLPFANPEQFIYNNVPLTNTTAVSLLPASGSLKIYLTGLVIVNTGTATSLITVTNGVPGGALLYGIAPAGGGHTITLPSPLAGTAGAALGVQAGTASSTIYVTAFGYYGL
jgi:hypothetical protein